VEPWLLNGQPANPAFRIDEFSLSSDITEQCLQERRSLLKHINTHLHGTDDRETMDAYGNLTATIFHCLGLDPDATITDTFGRPLPISRGEIIRPVLLGEGQIRNYQAEQPDANAWRLILLAAGR